MRIGENKKRNTSHFDVFALVVLVCYIVVQNSGFANINWNPTYSGWFNNVVSLCLLGYLVVARPRGSQYHFRTLVLSMMWIPFIAIFNSWSIYSQSPTRSFMCMLSQSVWVIYFILHKYKVREATVLKVFLCVALVIAGIQIVQQFTYPNAPFGTLSDEAMIEKHAVEAAEQRNGLWRFRMHQNGYYTAPILFFMWGWLQKKMSPRLALFVALLMASIYLTLTRQVMFACILAIFCSMFMGQKKINFVALFLGLVFIAVLYVNYDALFSKLAQQTQDDSNEDNVRLLAASILWGESLKTPFTFLFGFGVPDANSAYGIHMYKLKTFMGVFTSDVGFVGQIFERGFIYVCICYCMFARLFFKFKNRIPTYVRLFVLYAGVMSVMIFPCITAAQNIVWVMLLYVSDLHINKSPLTIQKSNL